jgi:hypothetical protein
MLCMMNICLVCKHIKSNQCMHPYCRCSCHVLNVRKQQVVTPSLVPTSVYSEHFKGGKNLLLHERIMVPYIYIYQGWVV